MSETHRTYCRNCTASCGLVVGIEGDRVTSIKGDRQHEMTEGYVCIKGRMSADWHNGEDRLMEPQIRGADGAFHPVDLDQALGHVHERLAPIIAQHGPLSVALYYGTGAKFNTLGVMALRGWLQSIGSPYLYSSSTIDQSAKWVTAARMGAFATGRHRMDDADVIMVVGANPNVSHYGPMPASQPYAWTQRAKAKGVKFIVLDPRQTEFARDADVHLPLRPGEDACVLAAMIRTILCEGWENREFCERFVTSLDQLRAAVEPFTAEMAAGRAGVPAADIVEAARLFSNAKRRSATTGTGPDMSANSNLNEHLVECLNAICGGYRRAGDVVRNTGSFSRQDRIVEGVVPPRRSWEQGQKLWTEDTGVIGEEYPTSRLPNEILHGGIRALIVIGGNLVTALGQPDKTLAALAKLDLLVVIDPRMTQTAELAHCVIPTKLPYERCDATTFVDTLFTEPFAQIAMPLKPPPPNVADDWEVFWGLSKRAGTPLSLKEYKRGGGGGAAPEYPLDMDVKPRSEHLLKLICEANRLPFEDLVRHPGGMRFKREPTVIGPAAEDDGARLDVCPPDVAQELARVQHAQPGAPRGYRLAVRRMMETMNSAFREASVTRRRYPLNYAFMNPGDMAREGFADGDRIEIKSDFGALVGQVRADVALREGVISMSHQWGEIDQRKDPLGDKGGFTGRLVSLEDHVETINYMPRQSGIPVDVQMVRKTKMRDTELTA